MIESSNVFHDPIDNDPCSKNGPVISSESDNPPNLDWKDEYVDGDVFGDEHEYDEDEHEYDEDGLDFGEESEYDGKNPFIGIYCFTRSSAGIRIGLVEQVYDNNDVLLSSAVFLSSDNTKDLDLSLYSATVNDGIIRSMEHSYIFNVTELSPVNEYDYDAFVDRMGCNTVIDGIKE